MSRKETELRLWMCGLAGVMLLPGTLAHAEEPADSAAAAIQRTLDLLATDIPRWPRENKCFSCHNNGDGARALLRAQQLGYRVDGRALESTLEFLRRPDRWQQTGEEEEFSDPRLPVIQFGAALLQAQEDKNAREPAALREAAALLAKEQDEDGAWKIDAAGSVGSPVTYGSHLATALARRILDGAGEEYRPVAEKAELWLLKQEPKTVLSAAATLWGLDNRQDPAAKEQRRRALAVIRQGQAKSGGWGPYIVGRAEPFDTAVVLLALAREADDAEVQKMIRGGREYLIHRQRDDGSWPETTRPPGAQSYAQRMSTTAWSVLALMETQPPSK